MQTVTSTGRLSSVEPNLQNIPVRLELGREIRTFFAGENSNVIVDADYSQIELRVLAHISDDSTMISSFKNNIDVHKVTASQVFDVPLDEVTSTMRTHAKAVNFGIVYGIGFGVMLLLFGRLVPVPEKLKKASFCACCCRYCGYGCSAFLY